MTDKLRGLYNERIRKEQCDRIDVVAEARARARAVRRLVHVLGSERQRLN